MNCIAVDGLANGRRSAYKLVISTLRAARGTGFVVRAGEVIPRRLGIRGFHVPRRLRRQMASQR